MREGAGTGVRTFVRMFLAAFVVCGLAGVNLWPLTGWRLFSHVRTDRISGWEITTVDPTGDERPVPFAALPAGYRASTHVAGGLGRLPAAERLETCRAWAAADPERRRVVEVRVYRVWESLRDLDAPRTRELRHACRVAVGR